ncbi:AAA ATPase Elf1 [Yamadazyma tenuis]|uniref:Transcription elongation factor 1 homolog n=1 Tax=Candida tenuis (strain ATCC 10573 / BCRC 21748 / CBS 615 / JCM 9827 / NBRC 10315 / NRRL Y-1498 / VKM Y-70) TaxID=590646 RepID=G3B493_CANTC|nr:uncharacterized protein CANTEDRAFT_105203 [Yamadazyma tenuis ATCC 10573]EGV63926.1 hypothetical protein CANTEDRAFT_105203 [Yamadazyma tenuis ATCC 10573]WEJ96456.1 AAA ATPase Elf1 [Yamadazyma tenuis]
MGKRKSSSRVQTKKVKQVLDITFTCLFCNHERSVICTLDKKNGIGELHCKICGQTFQSTIHSLSKPVDIYSDWIDACEDLEEEAGHDGIEVTEGEEHEEDDEEENDEFKRRKDPILDSDDDEY